MKHICRVTAHGFQIPTFDICVTYMSHTYICIRCMQNICGFRLEKLLERLQQGGFTLNGEKCKFKMPQLEFMG